MLGFVVLEMGSAVSVNMVNVVNEIYTVIAEELGPRGKLGATTPGSISLSQALTIVGAEFTTGAEFSRDYGRAVYFFLISTGLLSTKARAFLLIADILTKF